MKFTASTLRLLLNFVVVRGHPAPATDIITRDVGPNEKIAQDVASDVFHKILDPKNTVTAIVDAIATDTAGGIGSLADALNPDSPPPPKLDASNSNEQNATLAAEYVTSNIAEIVPVVGTVIEAVVPAVAGAIGAAADAVQGS